MDMAKRIVLCLLVCAAWYFGFVSLVEIIHDWSNQWYWLFVAAVYAIVINEIFGHMICAHGVVPVNPRRFTYRLLLFLSSVDHAWAPVTNLCRYHENHHRHADQGNKDNLNWRIHWYNVCTLSPLIYLYVRPTIYTNLDSMLDQQYTKHRAILEDPYTRFVENNRIVLTLTYWSVLYLILPVMLFKIVFLGRFLFSMLMVLAAILGHTKIPFGYRNFNTPDTSHNNLIFHYLALGLMPGMLQNNHHGSTKTQHRWFEFDTAGLVISMLKPLLSYK